MRIAIETSQRAESVVWGLVLVLLCQACSDRTGAGSQSGDADDPRVDLDLGVPDSDAPVADAPFDAEDGGDGGLCVVTVRTTADEQRTDCAFSPRTTLGCELLARCWCSHALGADASADELDECTFHHVVPRGALTLADYCAYSGTSSEVDRLPALWQRITENGGVSMPFEGEATLTFSPECDEVAAYTLWGEAPSWNLSVGESGAIFTTPPALLRDYVLDGEPLVRLADLAAARLAEASLTLTAAGRQRLAQRLAASDDAFVGRSFLIHSDTAALAVGAVVSVATSSTREGLVIVMDEVLEADSATVTLYDGHPPTGPAVLDYLTSGALAASGVWLDRACISSCGCNPGWACRAGRCVALDPGCDSGADCCLAGCSSAGVCESGP